MKQTSSYYSIPQQSVRKAFRIHLLVFVFALPATWIIWLFTGNAYPWPIWSTLSLSLGIVFHYLGVFVFSKSKKN